MRSISQFGGPILQKLCSDIPNVCIFTESRINKKKLDETEFTWKFELLFKRESVKCKRL